MVREFGQAGQSRRGLTRRLSDLQGLLIIRLRAEFEDKPVKRRPIQAGKGVDGSAVPRYDPQRCPALFNVSLVNDFGHGRHSLRAFGPCLTHEDGGNPALFVGRTARSQQQATQAKCKKGISLGSIDKDGTGQFMQASDSPPWGENLR